jgi:hypothetical protein
LEHWNAKFWSDIKNSGDFSRLPHRVRKAVSPLFENLFPRLDMAVIKANEAITELGKRWADQYGQKSPMSIKSCGIQSWWTFLANDSFHPVAIQYLKADVPFQMFNSYLYPKRLTELGLTFEELQRKMWDDARQASEFVLYRSLRDETLKEVPKALKSLDRAIGK